MSVVAPQAPRAMIQLGGTDPTASSWERIFHSAATKLYPRLILFEALAKSKGTSIHRPREQSGNGIGEARRDFLDSFAYLYDIEKGGKIVTATGLQKLPYSNILWLAANEGIGKDVKTYAESILRKLNDVETQPQNIVREDIFRLAVQNCTPRIQFYTEEMRKHARNCRMQLRQEIQDSNSNGLVTPTCDTVG